MSDPVIRSFKFDKQTGVQTINIMTYFASELALKLDTNNKIDRWWKYMAHEGETFMNCHGKAILGCHTYGSMRYYNKELGNPPLTGGTSVTCSVSGFSSSGNTTSPLTWDY